MFLPLPPGGSVIELAPVSGQFFSLFVDGTVVRGRQAGGAVLKDPSGQVVGTRSWAFPEQSLDSNLAEGNALEAGLKWLAEEGIQAPIVAYLDSYQVIEHLVKATNRYDVLQRIRSLLPLSPVVRVQNIERRRNKLADAAARAGLRVVH